MESKNLQFVSSIKIYQITKRLDYNMFIEISKQQKKIKPS